MISKWYAISMKTVVIAMAFEPWQLAMMDQAGYNGIREEHIEEVAQEILSMGISEVSRQDFDSAC